jgi:polyferredoxin
MKKWLRRKKTNIGIFIFIVGSIGGIFSTSVWFDIVFFAGVSIIIYGICNKFDRIMKWMRVDKK